MALSELGSTGVYVDLTKVTAKTAIEKTYEQSLWTFQVMVDGVWISVQYTTLLAATNAWNALV